MLAALLVGLAGSLVWLFSVAGEPDDERATAPTAAPRRAALDRENNDSSNRQAGGSSQAHGGVNGAIVAVDLGATLQDRLGSESVASRGRGTIGSLSALPGGGHEPYLPQGDEELESTGLLGDDHEDLELLLMLEMEEDDDDGEYGDGQYADDLLLDGNQEQPCSDLLPTLHGRIAGTMPELHPPSFRVEGDLTVQDLPGGRTAVTSIDPALQRAARATVRNYPIPYAAIVAMEISTGRILAMVSQSTEEPEAWDLPLRTCAPSASVFKIVTVAALIEQAGLNPNQQVCYHGGLRRLTERNILGCPRRDNRCNDMGAIISHSANSMVAKLTHQNLDHTTLMNAAEDFGYNMAIPFELPLQPSSAQIPADDPLEMARAAAGFWHTDMSAIHGALIAGAVANDGVMMVPSLVDRVVEQDGFPTNEASPMVLGQSVSPEVAATLKEMMRDTVTSGTARRSFNRWPRHWGIGVAGKTGSLSRRQPDFLNYSWFVAFAPMDNPQIAVAAMIGNGELWHVRAPTVVRQVLHAYFRNAGY